jgi:hypothetical protein
MWLFEKATRFCHSIERQNAETGELVAPLHSAPPQPEVRPAACLSPHRRRKGRPVFLIRADIPTRLGFGNDQKLNHVAAAARAAHADAPILAVVAREHEVATWHGPRQAVAFDHDQAPRWAEPSPSVTPPLPDVNQRSARRGALSMGRPSNGSRSPRAKMPRSERRNVPSAMNSSSPAAKLNSVRA